MGLDGMLYYLSTSANNGTLTINVTFKLGTNPDIAAVQTQNRVSIALPRLPPEVQRQGVTVKKVSSAFLMAVSLVATDNRYDSLFLSNYGQINFVNQLGSLPGIGDSRLGNSLIYSMRVWVNPDKMAKLGLTATDIANAITAQNRQNPAGAIGPAALAARHRFPILAQRAGPPRQPRPVRRHHPAGAAGRRRWCAFATWAIPTSARSPTAASAASTGGPRAT